QARDADPRQQREAELNRRQAKVQSSMDRLIAAFREELLTLEQLREQMPELQRQGKTIQMELQSLHMAAEDQSRYLRVVETLDQFRDRLRTHAEHLDMAERQRIVRLFVKEILVDSHSITIRHSIPVPAAPPDSGHSFPPPHGGPAPSGQPNYRLHTRSLATSKGCELKQP